MSNSLAEIAPTGEVDLRVISISGESYGSYILDKLNARSLKLTNKESGRLNFYISTARGTLNFDDLSHPIDVVLGADGESCNGSLSYENNILVVRLEEDPISLTKVVMLSFTGAKIREMRVMRRSTKEIVLKSVMSYVTLTICPFNKLEDLVYETSREPIRVEATEEYPRERLDIHRCLFFEELGAIILVVI